MCVTDFDCVCVREKVLIHCGNPSSIWEQKAGPHKVNVLDILRFFRGYE